jgi:hypothetical protein
LLWLLNPNESRFENLTQIAEAAGITKASISKSLLTFKDVIGLRLCSGPKNDFPCVGRLAVRADSLIFFVACHDAATGEMLFPQSLLSPVVWFGALILLLAPSVGW